jgi:hypothetical protein
LIALIRRRHDIAFISWVEYIAVLRFPLGKDMAMPYPYRYIAPNPGIVIFQVVVGEPCLRSF